MIVQSFFRVVWLMSLAVLLFTVFCFGRFLSTLNIPENDTDVSTWVLFTVDLALVVLFMVQHSGMLSNCYLDFMDDWGLTPIVRPIYTFASSVSLLTLMYHWQIIPEVYLWFLDISNSPVLSLFFLIAHWTLWIVLCLQVLVYRPLLLLGFNEAFYQQPSTTSQKLLQLLEHMPHAGAACFMAILWLHPYMTFDRLILATVFTAYLCCGMSLTGSDYLYVQKCCMKSTRTVYTTSYTTTSRQRKVQGHGY